MSTNVRRSTGEKPWAVNPAKVEAAIRRIVEVSWPVKLILFGSYVRGATNVNSDLDVLVIARNDVGDPRKESVRIRRALRGISMPMDILVVPEARWDELKEVPGLIYHEAHRTGRLVYEAREQPAERMRSMSSARSAAYYQGGGGGRKLIK